MVVAWNRAVECVHADVQNPVIQVWIFKDDLIHRAKVIMRREILRCDEMILVQISLSYRNKVDPYEEDHCKCYHCQPSLSHEGTLRTDCICLRCAVCPEKESECHSDQNKRAECVLSEKLGPVSSQGIDKNFRLTCVNSSCEASCNSWNQHAEQAESGRNSIGYVSGLKKVLLFVFFLDDPVEDIESKKREGHLQHDQSH